MASMTEVAGFIHGEMTKNAAGPTTKQIAAYNDSVLDFHKALDLWKSWVGNRRPWDHKPILRKTYGEWASDDVSRRDYNFDIWSNLHYGYVGRAAKFSAWTLKAGAGWAQWQAGTSPDGYWQRRVDTIGDADFLAAFDDPKDQVAIAVGTALWDSHGLAVTLPQLQDACRAAAGTLNTRALATAGTR